MLGCADVMIVTENFLQQKGMLNMTKEKEYEYCLRCGRKLKSDKTRKQGYGDICFKKMKVNHRNRLFTLPPKYVIM